MYQGHVSRENVWFGCHSGEPLDTEKEKNEGKSLVAEDSR